MKYLLLPLFFILVSCSLDKNSVYWNENPVKKSLEDKSLLLIKNKDSDFNKMTFDEFSIFLEEYSNKSDYPDINN